jgi:hypothetical protein
LALLMAACFEHAGLQPLLAVLDLGEWRHALVGCWLQPRANLESILEDKPRVLKGALWVESLGCTQASASRMDFHQACIAAEQQLIEKPLLFVVDVTAARLNDAIPPLPFTGEPQWSPVVSHILAQAQAFAQQTKQPLGTVPLLLGFLSPPGEVTRAVCERSNIQPAYAVHQLMAGLHRLQERADADDRTTRHYQQVLAAVRSLVRWEGAPLIHEHHLLRALLETPSDALDNALTRLGTNRQELTGRLHEVQNQLGRLPASTDLSSQF